MKRYAPRRRGLTLLEVLIGAVILMGATVILVQLAYVGRSHGESAGHWSEARRLCTNQLNELLAGLQPLENVADRPITDAPHWVYSVELEPLSYPGLVAVAITVRPAPDQEQRIGRRTQAYTLVRWVEDPDFDRDGFSQVNGGFP